MRGFSYAREVQPVIDRHCVRCHDGKSQPDGTTIADLRGDVKLADWSSVTPGNGGYAKTAGKFSVGYAALHRYVRRPGIESDFHVLEPLEFHADTTHLVQMLKQGHHGVKLDAEAWDRLLDGGDYFAVLAQVPATSGAIHDHRADAACPGS